MIIISTNRLIHFMNRYENKKSQQYRTEWSSKNEDERTKLEQKIAFNEKKQGLYIMRA